MPSNITKRVGMDAVKNDQSWYGCCKYNPEVGMGAVKYDPEVGIEA